MSAKQIVAVYCRVSSKRQDTKSQLPDLKRWTEAYADDQPVVWYTDKASGKTMDRPGWRKLEADIAAGKVAKVVVWRLDRLGRTASGLTALFEKLRAQRINLVSIRDGLDLETPAGRLMANVLASVAAYENEVRSERVLAGQAVARANGKTWGGRKVGTTIRLTEAKQRTILLMRQNGESISEISRAVELGRPTIYKFLEKLAG